MLIPKLMGLQRMCKFCFFDLDKKTKMATKIIRFWFCRQNLHKNKMVAKIAGSECIYVKSVNRI